MTELSKEERGALESILERGTKGFKSAMLASPSPWVSVKERLPEKRTEVLMATGDKNIYVGAFTSEELFISGPWIRSDITHWMPLDAIPLPEDER